MCGTKISRERAEYLADLFARADAAGFAVHLLTLTLRHSAEDSLRSLIVALRDGWRFAISGPAPKKKRKKAGLVGWVRAFECTCGDAGWHPHLHVALVYDGPTSEEMGREFGSWLWERFARRVAAHGFESLQDHGGFDYRASWSRATWVADYFTKLQVSDDGPGYDGLAAEVALGSLKDARLGNRTTFALLRDATINGDADALDLWHEWEETVTDLRVRQIDVSPSLRVALHLAEERTDEEIAEDSPDEDGVLRTDGHSYARVVRWHVAELLALLEDGGPAALRAWFRRRGLPCWAPGEDPPDEQRRAMSDAADLQLRRRLQHRRGRDYRSPNTAAVLARWQS